QLIHYTFLLIVLLYLQLLPYVHTSTLLISVSLHFELQSDSYNRCSFMYISTSFGKKNCTGKPLDIRCFTSVDDISIDGTFTSITEYFVSNLSPERLTPTNWIFLSNFLISFQ